MILRFLTLCLALCGLALSQGVKAEDAGTLISAEPVVDTSPGSQAWRVTYWTRSESDEPLRVTGVVIAPREAMPRAPRKVVAWTHGTAGVVERCAPSSSSEFFASVPALGDMIRAGYVVVAPDYPGLGSSMPHGYLAGRETGRSVLDAIRAARQISGAAAGNDFVVWGESQGGHAALWTAIESRHYARELNLLGTLAVAPPTDLRENLRQASDQNARALLAAFLTYSWSERYGAPMDSVFNRIDRGVATRLARNNCVRLEASPRIGTILGILAIRNAIKDKDIGSLPVWSRLARRNSVSARKVPGPIYIAQAIDDPIVASSITANFARKLCRKGRAVQYESLPGSDHANSGRNSTGSALAWIANRFDGRQPNNSCRALSFIQ